MASRNWQRTKTKKDRIGIAIIGLAVVVIIGLVAVYFSVGKKHVALDKECLCPTSGPCEIIVVLLDQTDTFSTIQRASLRNHLKGITSEIPRYGLLELHTIGPVHDELLKPLFKLCNPGRGSDVSQVTANPGRVEKRWNDEFYIQLERNLENILVPSQAQNSPILESIQSVAVSAFGDPSLSSVPKRLIIISDMLQHTPAFSQYNQVVDFEKFSHSNYYPRIRPNLKNVQVEIYYLRRSTNPQIQGKKHMEFWQALILDAGGTITRVISVDG